MELLSVEDSDPLGDGGKELAPDDKDPTTVERGENGSLLMLNDPGEDGSPAEMRLSLGLRLTKRDGYF